MLGEYGIFGFALAACEFWTPFTHLEQGHCGVYKSKTGEVLAGASLGDDRGCFQSASSLHAAPVSESFWVPPQ